MIRGYFSTTGGRNRPYVDGVFQFPGGVTDRSLEVRLLVDTGADRTLISPRDAGQMVRRLGIDLAALPRGAPGAGVGGQADTRTIEAVLTLGNFSVRLTLPILEPPPGPLPPIPSLLGRDIISHFALFMEERTNRVLLLEPHEADPLNIPS